MAMPSNLKDPAVAKKLFENLQGDLRALSSEGKKKHANVREVSFPKYSCSWKCLKGNSDVMDEPLFLPCQLGAII